LWELRTLVTLRRIVMAKGPSEEVKAAAINAATQIVLYVSDLPDAPKRADSPEQLAQLVARGAKLLLREFEKP
jgi:hypothetical protein